MMVKVLIYAYATGVFSSRRIARQLRRDVAFRVLGVGNFPKHRTICEFRRRHLEDFRRVFAEVVGMNGVDFVAGRQVAPHPPLSRGRSPGRGACTLPRSWGNARSAPAFLSFPPAVACPQSGVSSRSIPR